MAFVEATVFSRFRSKEIKLVSKRPANFYYTDDPLFQNDKALLYYQIWFRLKLAHLPVVNTVRISSHDEVMMSDLTADGSVLYDKHALYLSLNGRGSEDGQTKSFCTR